MSQHAEQKGGIHYDPAGTLIKPGVIGRSVRLILGILCTMLAWDVATASSPDLAASVSWWLVILLALIVVNYVVNIGFGLAIGQWPLIGSIALLTISAVTSSLSSGNPFAYPLFISSAVWMSYVFAHLGLSFLLAATLGTPGCEMRAIPHLIGMVRGMKVSEHYCPAFIDNIDKWEYQRNQGIDPIHTLDEHDPRNKDLLGSAGKMLQVYGLAFVAIQLAGNLGGFTVATLVPAVAFIYVAIICLVNISRCRRVHCYLIGPLFLSVGIALGLYGFRMFSLGSSTWPILVNGGLIGGACLAVKMELLMGHYFEKKSAP